MRSSLAVLGLGVFLAVPAATLADSAAQSLSIALHGDGARATQLPAYDPASPIAVTVNDLGAAKIDAVTVVAAGPEGESLHTPLARGADGNFTGALTLADQGTWRLRLSSRTGKTSFETSPVTLDVQAPPPSDAWQIGTAVGAAIFVVIGGSGFYLLRRIARVEPDRRVAPTA